MAGNDRTEHDHTRHDHAHREPTAPVHTGGATVRRGTAREAVAAQRAVFGGVSWGAAVFGWLSGHGLAGPLIAVLFAPRGAPRVPPGGGPTGEGGPPAGAPR